MTERHWSNEDLLNYLYEVGPADNHPDRCPECLARLKELEARRRGMLPEAEAPYAFLAAQRRAIYSRLDDPTSPRISFRFAPALAAAAVLLVAVLLSRPTPAPVPTFAAAGGDSQFYTEIYSTVSSDIPFAVAPIQGLFDQ